MWCWLGRGAEFSRRWRGRPDLTECPETGPLTLLFSPVVRRSDARQPSRAASPRSASCPERSPLGAHSKPSRVRLPQAAAGAAAPALGVAAAICLPAQAASAAAVPSRPVPATSTATAAAATVTAAHVPAAYRGTARTGPGTGRGGDTARLLAV